MYPTGPTEAMPETMLLTGPAEPSNLGYATAKNAGYVHCLGLHKQYGVNYFTVIPASLYGPHDNFDLNMAHVTPALLLRFHLAKKAKDEFFTVWGTGKPRRELLFAEDAARGIRLLLEKWHASKGPVNLGAGDDLSVKEIAETIQKVVGFEGQLKFDLSKPDGNPRKLLDSTKAKAIGFSPLISLESGLKKTYDWLLSKSVVRGVKPEDL
jgi:GDP-L-fucose synthase